MTEKKFKQCLLKIMRSLDERISERISESSEYLFFFPNGEDADYHEGRVEALEVTRQQIQKIFAEEMK